MNDYDYLKFCMELLNLMIDEIEDLSFKAELGETFRRLTIGNTNLKKAYEVISPIIYRKDMI